MDYGPVPKRDFRVETTEVPAVEFVIETNAEHDSAERWFRRLRDLHAEPDYLTCAVSGTGPFRVQIFFRYDEANVERMIVLKDWLLEIHPGFRWRITQCRCVRAEYAERW